MFWTQNEKRPTCMILTGTIEPYERRVSMSRVSAATPYRVFGVDIAHLPPRRSYQGTNSGVVHVCACPTGTNRLAYNTSILIKSAQGEIARMDVD